MKNLPLLLLTFSIGIFSCNNNTQHQEKNALNDTMSIQPDTLNIADNSRTSLDWPGTYVGTLPCADCPGIKETLTLKSDETFHIITEYLERNTKIEDSGKFTWSKDGGKIMLKTKDGSLNFKVGESMLLQLDQEGNEIGGVLAEHYIYKKM